MTTEPEEKIGKYFVIDDNKNGEKYKFLTDIPVGELWALGINPKVADKKHPTEAETIALREYNLSMVCAFSLDPKIVRVIPETNPQNQKFKLFSSLDSLLYQRAISEVNRLYRKQQKSFLPQTPTTNTSKSQK